MAAETLAQLLDQLNTALGEFTPYKLDIVDPATIEHVPLNAHFMPKRIFDQLTANIKQDGNLASVPFCWRKEDGTVVVLSGNHRVDSAIQANIPRILILYTDQDMSQGERVAVQLSHNALVGQDNPAQLLDLWQQMDDLSLKIYSGLDDGTLGTLQPVEVARINDAALRFEELTFLFLPAERERIQEVVSRLGQSSKARLAADVATFDAFFNALLDFKEAAGILNASTALLQLVQIAEGWIEQQRVEHAEVPTS